MDGFINLLKPPGMTSSDAVVFVRRMLPRGTRVGHGGTLDPDAAGVLPIMVGRAARLFDYIVDKQKTYIAELTLGIATDTQDATGGILQEKLVSAGEAEVRAALRHFLGDIWQTPPDYSAIKKDGKRLYELARRGEPIAVPARQVHVHSIQYLQQTGAARHMLRISCGKGLYIRTLLHDIGAGLGCGGHMSFLLRSRAGAFELADARTPDEIAEAGIDSLLLPMDMPLGHLPRVDVDERHRRAIRNGNPVRPEWMQGEAQASTRVYCGGRFCGMGEPMPDGALRFKAMLLDGEDAPCE